jgi:M6 family metalloprotease-like protein
MRLSFRAVGAVGALALICAGEAHSQTRPIPPAPGRREIPNIDISANGGWRARVRNVQAARRAALARGDLRALNAPSATMAVQGELSMPVVFLYYSDTTVTPGVTAVIGDTGQYRSVFFSADPMAESTPRPYSLKTYYEQLSNGALTIDGAKFGWINTGRTYASVGQNCAGVFPPCSITTIRANFGQFLKAALDSLNGVNGAPQVDWGQFDNDGPDGVPNSGDDNGVVDFVTFVHPTLGGECGGGGGGQTGNRIWAHRWTLTSALGSQYTTNTPRSGGGFIRINDYTIQSARGGASSCSASGIMPVGTLAHETGHTFNIPDLYATAGASEGVGEFSLMGSGNYTRPNSPVTWDAWSLMEVGWINVDSLTTSRTVTLAPVQTGDTVLVARVTGSDEYFIFENRARLQSDTANQDASLGSRQKSPGLLVWHIDQSVVDGGRADNTVNAGTIEGVHLLQADGLEELHAGTNRGDAGDTYPGTTVNRAITYHSNPAMTANDGSVAGFVVDSIQQVSDTGAIVFRFRRSAPFRVTSTAVALGGVVSVNGVGGASYEELFALGDTAAVTVADTQLVNTGRTQLIFGSWSDAGARSHTIVSDGTPDTVVATLQARHRVNFVANGDGTVGTSGPATNTFVDAGTPVTLTATPNGGATFTNWTGDTTTSNATLILPMGKPYSVTANFTGAVAVTYDEATTAILGLTPLSGAQATYLDAVGNNNAVYDLGDYLAYLKANAIVASPEVLRRVQAIRPVITTKER